MLQHIDAASVAGALSWRAAVEALRASLAGGLDPDDQPPRAACRFGSGELLAMPATAPGGQRLATVKLATIAPPGAEPRVHAVVVLFDAATLAPLATIDGTALTALRTPAVSALAVDLVAPAATPNLLVFGAGPQAEGHVHALRAVRDIEQVGIIGRTPQRVERLVRRLRADGIDARSAQATDVARSDLIVCCTTARTPLFEGRELSDTAVVVACGSHEPDAREVDAETVRRCGVVVESVPVAMREAGDVVLAVAEVALHRDAIVTLTELVRQPRARPPRLIKTVGMGWEDLVVAAAIWELHKAA